MTYVDGKPRRTSRVFRHELSKFILNRDLNRPFEIIVKRHKTHGSPIWHWDFELVK